MAKKKNDFSNITTTLYVLIGIVIAGVIIFNVFLNGPKKVIKEEKKTISQDMHWNKNVTDVLSALNKKTLKTLTHKKMNFIVTDLSYRSVPSQTVLGFKDKKHIIKVYNFKTSKLKDFDAIRSFLFSKYGKVEKEINYYEWTLEDSAIVLFNFNYKKYKLVFLNTKYFTGDKKKELSQVIRFLSKTLR